MTPSIINTIGELEPERCSRRANVIEALGVTTALFVIMWPFCYGWGVLGDNAAVRQVAQWPLVALFVWVVFVSPRLHGDTAESLGVGNPRELWRTIRERRGFRRVRLVGAVVTIACVIFLLTVANWPESARMLRLPVAARQWILAPHGWVPVCAIAGALSVFVATCAIRYDNYAPAFRAALCVSAGLFVFAGAGAMLHRGPAVFANFDAARWGLDAIAYMFWGYAQQFLFTSYFATRLRKGFAPAPAAEKSVPLALRPRFVAIGGLLTATTIAPAFWLAVRNLYGANHAPLAMLAWFAVFAFPIGALWAHFYCRDRRRMLVATLAGSIFGLIHIDSYGLVLVTTGLGTILAWLFMDARYRNLSALGFIHGVLGSTFGKLFKGAGAGTLRVDYRVGPWNVEEPTFAVLVIPTLCLCGFLALTMYFSRREAWVGSEAATP
ncbi:MAG: hypothetical protein ABMA13_07015 [Chthoniobacteraceae bacterium]